jgi:hypothetical protein
MTKKLNETKKDFDYTTIKSFEDACLKLGLDPTALPELKTIPDEFRKPLIAVYRLMIIYKAINNGWTPDWNDWHQNKYFPWYEFLSSGFGFSISDYCYAYTVTDVGSRLCTDTNEKALYIAKQFEAEYKDFFLYSE